MSLLAWGNCYLTKALPLILFLFFLFFNLSSFIGNQRNSLFITRARTHTQTLTQKVIWASTNMIWIFGLCAYSMNHAGKTGSSLVLFCAEGKVYQLKIFLQVQEELQQTFTTHKHSYSSIDKHTRMHPNGARPSKRFILYRVVLISQPFILSSHRLLIVCIHRVILSAWLCHIINNWGKLPQYFLFKFLCLSIYFRIINLSKIISLYPESLMPAPSNNYSLNFLSIFY